MHRSGTSAVTGMLEEEGLVAHNLGGGGTHSPRGTREDRRLRRLHERILARNGGHWWAPPRTPVTVIPGERRRRDEILSSYGRHASVIKDPRMLLIPELWREMPMQRLGVFRNPYSVARSLLARGGPAGALGLKGAVELWKAYCRALREEHDLFRFPIVNFDGADTLEKQVRSALPELGVKATARGGFFEPGLPRHSEPNWREKLFDREALALYEDLASRSVRLPAADGRSPRAEPVP
jgi:hypothetical protein